MLKLVVEKRHIMYKVDNAIIMAAGTSSRFAPLSYEIPKALITVKGEVLIERQIKQLKEAGIKDIIVVVGYKSQCFEYLKDKYNVKLIKNEYYLFRNNNASIYAAKEYLKNSYICSSDNYFSKNPFETEVDGSYYAAVYSEGETNEWCMTEDKEGYINNVTIGGSDSWYMLGHCFWDENFSRKFISILEDVYNQPETQNLLWESIFSAHLDELKMRIRKYDSNIIFEFDTLDELREFDESYVNDTRSKIIKEIVKSLKCSESDIKNVHEFKDFNNSASGFCFECKRGTFQYIYNKKVLRRIEDE